MVSHHVQVELGELDAQMVQLARKQRAYHKSLSQKEELQEQLTKVGYLSHVQGQVMMSAVTHKHTLHMHLHVGQHATTTSNSASCNTVYSSCLFACIHQSTTSPGPFVTCDHGPWAARMHCISGKHVSGFLQGE